MDHLKRGITFLQQVWRIAREDPDLLKPTLYALAAGLAASLVCLVPIALALILQGGSPVGPALAGFFGAVLVFSQLLCGYLFSAMTMYLVSEKLAAGKGQMDHAWAIVRRDWLDILSLAVASVLVGLLRSIPRGKGNHPERNLAGEGPSALWTEATYLILPAMALENLNLKAALARTAQMVGDNLVMMGVNLVGVRWINALTGLVLGGTGVALGWAAGAGLAAIGGADVAQGNLAGLFAAIAAGVLIASLFILAAVGVTSFTASAYHTCLFLWARDVERTRAADPAADGGPSGPAGGGPGRRHQPFDANLFLNLP